MLRLVWLMPVLCYHTNRYKLFVPFFYLTDQTLWGFLEE